MLTRVAQGFTELGKRQDLLGRNLNSEYRLLEQKTVYD